MTIAAAVPEPIYIAGVTAFIVVAQSPIANTPGIEVSLNIGDALISPLSIVSSPSCSEKGPLRTYFGPWA